MEKIITCGLLCLLLFTVAFGGEKECDKQVTWVWGDCDEVEDLCMDTCEDSFEDYSDVQVLTSMCVSETCLCHISSETMCDDHLQSPSPSPSPSLGSGGGGGGGGGGGVNFRLM